MPVLSLLDSIRCLVAFVVRSDRGVRLVRGVPHSLRIFRTNPHPELGPMALNVLPIGCSESHIGVQVGEECLPQLHGKLIKRGISPKRATSICQAILSGKKQRAIKTVEQYQEAWTVADSSNEILTTIEDGSKLAAWSMEYNHALFDFEDAYFAKHGHMPLNPGPAEMTDGPTGRA